MSSTVTSTLSPSNLNVLDHVQRDDVLEQSPGPAPFARPPSPVLVAMPCIPRQAQKSAKPDYSGTAERERAWRRNFPGAAQVSNAYDCVMELAYVGGAASTAAPAAAPAAARPISQAKKPSPGVNLQPGKRGRWLDFASAGHAFRRQRSSAIQGRRRPGCCLPGNQSAQRYIALEVYIFASDETGRAFAELLCKRRGRAFGSTSSTTASAP